MMQYFIEHEGLVHGKTKIQASRWSLLNGSYYSFKHTTFCMWTTIGKIMARCIISFWVGPSSDRESCNSLQNKLLSSSRVLFWRGKEKLRSQFNHLFRLGIVHLEDVVDNESQRLSEFDDAKRQLCIPPIYGFISEKLQDIPLLHGSLPLKTKFASWVDWRLRDGTQLLYHHVMASLPWLSPKAENV